MNLFFLLFYQVQAAPQSWSDLRDSDVATFQSLETLFANVVRAAVALSVVALFIMFLVGGFHFLLSGGDQKKLEAAKGTLTGAIAGLVVIVVAYLILRTIEVFTGAKVTQFRIPLQ